MPNINLVQYVVLLSQFLKHCCTSTKLISVITFTLFSVYMFYLCSPIGLYILHDIESNMSCTQSCLLTAFRKVTVNYINHVSWFTKHSWNRGVPCLLLSKTNTIFQLYLMGKANLMGKACWILIVSNDAIFTIGTLSDCQRAAYGMEIRTLWHFVVWSLIPTQKLCNLWVTKRDRIKVIVLPCCQDFFFFIHRHSQGRLHRTNASHSKTETAYTIQCCWDPSTGIKTNPNSIFTSVHKPYNIKFTSGAVIGFPN